MYYDAGVELWLDGRKSNPDEVTDACMAYEGSDYMRDYISDEEDSILAIGFQKIHEK